MQVQKLEEELGIKLFYRDTKSISITTVGIKVLAQTKKIVAESQRIKDVVASEKGIPSGTLSLGIIPTVMPALLPIFLKKNC